MNRQNKIVKGITYAKNVKVINDTGKLKNNHNSKERKKLLECHLKIVLIHFM